MRNIIFVFIFALILRFSFLAFWYQSGQGDRISSDAQSYLSIAKSIHEGKGFQLDGEPTARRPPLYPAWIAFFLKFSTFPLGVQIGDAWLGAISCLLLYGIGKELFGGKIGLISAGVLAIDYISIRQIVSIMSETLFLVFLLACFYFLILSFKKKESFLFFLAGIFGGMSLLTREVLILYFPLLILWILFLGGSVPKKRIQWTIFFLLGLALAVGPWMVRNSVLYHHPVLITTTAGHTFYIANNPMTSGGRTGGDWEWEKDSFLPNDPNLETYKPPADAKLFKQGFEFIAQNPKKVMKLAVKKIINTWRPYQTDSALPVRWITAVPYILIVFFAIIGIVKSAGQWRELMPVYLLIAYVFLLHAVLIAEIRYRYPAMPFLMLFAAFGIMSIIEKNKKTVRE